MSLEEEVQPLIESVMAGTYDDGRSTPEHVVRGVRRAEDETVEYALDHHGQTPRPFNANPGVEDSWDAWHRQRRETEEEEDERAAVRKTATRQTRQQMREEAAQARAEETAAAMLRRAGF